MHEYGQLEVGVGAGVTKSLQQTVPAPQVYPETGERPFAELQIVVEMQEYGQLGVGLTVGLGVGVAVGLGVAPQDPPQ